MPLNDYTRPSHQTEGPPPGWKPGVELTGREGTITSAPSTTPDPSWDALLTQWGFSPDEYEIVEPVSVSTWEGYIKNKDGEFEKHQLWAHRAGVRKRTRNDKRDAELISKSLSKPRRMVDRLPVQPPVTFVVAISDMQVGKGEGGGSEAIVDRVVSCLEQAEQRLIRLKTRYNIERIAILNPGDPIENTCGWYPNQIWEIDLDRRDQVKVAARLFTTAIETFSAHRPVIFGTCDSNHGENRQGGKVLTSPHDSADMEIAERIAEAYALAGREDVTFVIPEVGYVTNLGLSGVNLALAHGHRAPHGVHMSRKQWEWWKGQALGGLTAGDARILVTGHYHHTQVAVDYGRTWFQCPALDGGSDWLTRTTGQHSPAGMMTLLVGANLGALGWGEMEVLYA